MNKEPIRLSVIIVNYNVQHFLEQALSSIIKACRNISAEIIVVDNASVDGSVALVKEKFSEITLIANTENVGFSKANNQGIRLATGDYILLINPDTVVEEDCFEKIIPFMDAHPDAGGLGVRMIDGSGKFLPESKRSLPTPEVAFYKMFGLASLFPKSKRFGRYHLGFLDEHQIHEVEVLSGAFMMLRKTCLDKIGLLDEDYFMYGEDIDLSYRVTLGGFKNYYFPETGIIHYKGESTKKTSVNYVFTFYRAMIIFAQKHYSSKSAGMFSLLIHFAIYVRAFLAIIQRIVRTLIIPLSDFLILFICTLTIIRFWGEYRFGHVNPYPEQAVKVNALVYSILWMLGLSGIGTYLKRHSAWQLIRGMMLGTIGIAVYYAFLDESYRFSRMIIPVSACISLLAIIAFRFILTFIQSKKIAIHTDQAFRTIFVGNQPEVKRVQELLIHSKSNSNYIGYVGTTIAEHITDEYLGSIQQLEEIVRMHQAEEIIFCSADIEVAQIISHMSKIAAKTISFKIVPKESEFIIGSQSKNSPGDFYTIELNLALNKESNLIKKRLFDIIASIILLPFTPILILLVKNKFHFIQNILSVLMGEKTWVSYAQLSASQNLPPLKKGVLQPQLTTKENHSVTARKINFLYAKDYSVEKDIFILLASIRELGN